MMLNIYAGLCAIQNWIENVFRQEVELEWREEEFTELQLKQQQQQYR